MNQIRNCFCAETFQLLFCFSLRIRYRNKDKLVCFLFSLLKNKIALILCFSCILITIEAISYSILFRKYIVGRSRNIYHRLTKRIGIQQIHSQTIGYRHILSIRYNDSLYRIALHIFNCSFYHSLISGGLYCHLTKQSSQE